MKVTPQQDTGWGVIYRLNGLFAEVEELAPSGKYDEWNIKLDRIWSNLVYRNALEWEKDDTGKITSVKLSDDDFARKDFLDKEVLLAKSLISKARKKILPEEGNRVNPEYIQAKKKLYRTLMLKEIWLRKYMHELGLYLKEISHNPAGSMFGK